MKAKRLLFLVMAICFASGVKAQFYDSADDIYFYVECKNGELKDNTMIFNFDGSKACCWSESVFTVKYNLKSNPSYYEDKVETTEYNLKYTSGNTYQTKSNSNEGYTNYIFSYDRSTLNYHSHWWCILGMSQFPPFNAYGEYRDDKRTFKKVDKSFFKVGRSRTPSKIIYE